MAGKRIFIVDDDRTTAKVIELQLKGMGYAVVGHARTSAEAVRGIEAQNPDLVLMDINLGRGSDGIDTASAIQRERAIPVIYVTAYSDESTLERARISHPFGYINKPLRPDDLRTTIALALDRAATMRAEEVEDAKSGKIQWKVEWHCDAGGKTARVGEEALLALKIAGFRDASSALPAAHGDHIATCLRTQRPHLVTGTHSGHVYSWEFRPAARQKAVRVTMTDITRHSRLMDQNILQASLSEALDSLSTGIIFINENLKVFYSNKSAGTILRDGRELFLKENHLRCSTMERTAELQRLVLQETGNTFTIERSTGNSPLHLLVSPLHSHNENYGHDLPISIVYVFEAAKDTDRIRDVIRSLYSLSPTEARIAAKLVLQPDLVAVAKSMGITYNTARTHLKRIYAKTNINRLPSLVHMIVTGPVGLLIHSSE
ncbi:MAG: response regulator [Gammaproteobacteria bacterium]|nr:response regulator [Gammaproteobacteria bacterium]